MGEKLCLTLGLPQFTSLCNYLLIADIYNRYTKIRGGRNTVEEPGTGTYLIHTLYIIPGGVLTSGWIHGCHRFTLLWGLIGNTAMYYTAFMMTFHEQDSKMW